MLRYAKILCYNFLRDQKGGALETVMVAGVISLSLMFFLVTYGQNVAQFVKTKSPTMMKEVKQWDN